MTALVAQTAGQHGLVGGVAEPAAVVAGLHDRQAAPGHGGSANRHTDVRGSKPQVGYSQEGALTKPAPARSGRRIVLTGIGPAATVPRRSVRLAATVAPISAVTVAQQASLGHHLGPQEPGQLPGDGGGDHVLGVLAGGQPHASGRTAAAGPPTPEPPPGDPGLAGAGVARARPPGGAGRPRPTRPAGRAGGRCHTW